MGTPGFTAASSLERTRSAYRTLSGPLRPVGSPVMAQFIWDPSSIDSYMVPDFFCPPPFCGRDSWGRCHCLSVQGGYLGG
jgi:hypothetical protein